MHYFFKSSAFIQIIILSLHHETTTKLFRLKIKNMTKLEAYNEAKEVCISFINYTGDKRKMGYKRLERMVFEVAARRVNNFGIQLGLPSFNDLRGL